jgi:hypothetical protein
MSRLRNRDRRLVLPFVAIDGRPQIRSVFDKKQRLLHMRAKMHEVVEEFEGPHWSGFGEVGGVRSTNLRHHSDSHRHCFFIERRNRYEPLHSIPLP